MYLDYETRERSGTRARIKARDYELSLAKRIGFIGGIVVYHLLDLYLKNSGYDILPSLLDLLEK